MAARTAAELPLGSDLKSLTQALTERSLDTRGHLHLDHCYKRAELEQIAQRSLPFHAEAYAYLGCSSLRSRLVTSSRHRSDRVEPIPGHPDAHLGMLDGQLLYAAQPALDIPATGSNRSKARRAGRRMKHQNQGHADFRYPH